MYAVKVGRVPGVYATWAECSKQVTGFRGAEFKKIAPNEADDYLKDKVDYPDALYVYCDGSCIHNGRPNARAGIGIYFGPDDPRNVSERISGNTNNIAELTAMLRVYDLIQDEPGQVCIVSDSKYALLCVGSYGKRCEANGWPDIPNRRLVQQVYSAYKDTAIQFLHVYAHTQKTDMHSLGNAGADRLAFQSLSQNLLF